MPGIRDGHTASKAAHRKTLRTSAVLPVAIPAALLVGLWGYTATGLVADRMQVQDDMSLASAVDKPGYDMLAQLQEERRLTAVWQAHRSDATRAKLEEARSNTSAAIESYRRSTDSSLTGKEIEERAKQLDGLIEDLARKRSDIDRRVLSQAKAFDYYSDTIAATAAVLEVAVQADDQDLARTGHATTSLLQMTEMLSREDALLAGASATGELPESIRSQFAQYVAIQRHIRTALLDTDDLPREQAAAYQRLINDPKWKQLAKIEDAVTDGSGTQPPPEAKNWQSAAATVNGGLRDISADSFEAISEQGSDRADALLLAFILGSLGVLAALVVTGVLVRRAAGSASHRLTVLRKQIEELGEQRLPEILQKLERGEHMEEAGELPTAGPDADDLERLGVAVQRLGREFEAALLRQARGREGTEKVFANLTRRTQILVHRLISLLDDLERKHEDSDLLQDIFKVDHLATRVRRHSENLVILGGSSPGRRGIRPLSITDVVRGAVSETEQYRRVTVQSLPPGRQVLVAARAVTDLTHLLAELIENGTTFSPPDTQVQISARTVARGLALHVEDRGLGMPPEQYEHLNELLANPPQPDMDALGKDPRLGLFVVAKLAERHGLKVSLRESDYGGTLAVVLVPSALLEEHESPLPKELKQAAGLANGSGGAPVRFPDALVSEQRASRTEPPADPKPPVDTRPEPAAPAAPAAAKAPAAASAPQSSGTPTPESDAISVPEIVTAHATTTPPQFETHGFPEYGGAGLLPAATDQEATGPRSAWSPVHEQTGAHAHAGPGAEQYGTQQHVEFGSYGGQHAVSNGGTYVPEPPIEHVSPPAGPLGKASAGPLDEPPVLPTRTRGASLAKQLREEAGPARSGQAGPGRSGRENVEEEVSSSFTPGRSAANMMAIQRATRRARESQAPDPAELNSPAESRQHGTDEL